MNRRHFALVGLSSAGAMILGGKAWAGLEEQAQQMVAKAVALYDEKGDAAIAVFNEGAKSGFEDGEVYIVVQSTGPDGKVLAHGANPKLVGTPLADIADANGKKFGEEMSAQATAAGGWFEYQWPNPESGQVQKKRSWAVLHKGLVFIAGFYAP